MGVKPQLRTLPLFVLNVRPAFWVPGVAAAVRHGPACTAARAGTTPDKASMRWPLLGFAHGRCELSGGCAGRLEAAFQVTGRPTGERHLDLL